LGGTQVIEDLSGADTPANHFSLPDAISRQIPHCRAEWRADAGPALSQRPDKQLGTCFPPPRRREELSEAHRLFTEIGANGYAERVAGELAVATS
jgi:hypothetical protein